MRINAACYAGFALGLVAVQPADAQNFGSLPEGRRFEIGYSSARMERYMKYEGDRTATLMDWGRASVFVRAKPWPRITMGLEALQAHHGRTDRFPDRDYVAVTAGALLLADLGNVARASLRLGVRHSARFEIDQSPDRYDKREDQTQAALITETVVLRAASHSLSFWAGPAYTRDIVFQYPRFSPSHAHSERDWGGLIGGQLVVARRLRVFGETGYAGRWQFSGGSALAF